MVGRGELIDRWDWLIFIELVLCGKFHVNIVWNMKMSTYQTIVVSLFMWKYRIQIKMLDDE